MADQDAAELSVLWWLYLMQCLQAPELYFWVQRSRKAFCAEFPAIR